MKQEWKGPVRLAVVLFALYLAVHYWTGLSAMLLVALGAAFPLLVGAVTAYAVNILMAQYERWYFPPLRAGPSCAPGGWCACCWPTPAWWPSWSCWCG